MGRRAVATIGLVLLGLLTLAPALGAAGERASGTLIDTTGATIGRVELTQEANGVRMVVRITDEQRIRPGNHGIHFHAVGRCDTPDFASASGHFNPTARQHGAKNPQGAHAGDIENLVVPANAVGGVSWATTSTLFTLAAGPTGIFDADGAALVIHAAEDDETTDPTGNSGGRIACAILQPVATPGMPNTGAGGGALPMPLVILVGVATVGVGLALLRRRVSW